MMDAMPHCLCGRIIFEKKMRQILFLLFTLVFAGAAFAAPENDKMRDETLRYVVTYKWGLVVKDAGDATLTLRNKGNNYNIMLVGHSRPWVDRFYPVRDTLKAIVARDGFRPLRYERIAHEGKKFARDIITYSYSGSNITGAVEKFRQREKENEIDRSTATMQARIRAFDMLTIFYYLRRVDYGKMAQGQMLRTTMFSGSQSESLTVRCLGETDIKLHKSDRVVRTYHIRFNFTSGGGKKSSADIEAWIGTDASHIPYLVEGSLPLGKVKCYYVGGGPE